jgi:large subunit ribosomal protein L3
MIGIIGQKIGMTQFFKETGERVPVTLIAAGPCPVLQIKKPDKDGYSALQLGFGQKRETLVNLPMKGHLKKSGSKSVRAIREFRISGVDTYKVGQLLGADIFQQGDHVDISGISIGKGFQGGIKRWGWAGGKKSHGSMHHRRVGSIGASSYPSRVTKGHQMPGRMGGVRKTIQNLEIVKIDKENNIIAVKGSVPGNENSYLEIRESIKIPSKRDKQPTEQKSDEKAKK